MHNMFSKSASVNASKLVRDANLLNRVLSVALEQVGEHVELIEQHRNMRSAS